MANLEGIVYEAVEEFREWCKDNPGSDPTYDGTLHEFADGAVPVYNGDLLDLAAGNNDLALTAPEIGPAFDGTPTPINIIAANVYEAVEAGLYQAWQEIEEERKEEED